MRFSICQEHAFLCPDVAIPSWVLPSWHSMILAKALQHLCQAPVHRLHIGFGHKGSTGNVHSPFPFIPVLAANLFFQLLLQRPLSLSILVKRPFFLSITNWEICYTKHLPCLQLFTSSPWAEDHCCNRGELFTYSPHMWSRLPFPCLSQMYSSRGMLQGMPGLDL